MLSYSTPPDLKKVADTQTLDVEIQWHPGIKYWHNPNCNIEDDIMFNMKVNMMVNIKVIIKVNIIVNIIFNNRVNIKVKI